MVQLDYEQPSSFDHGETRFSLVGALAGFGYGGVLDVANVLSAGIGHGCYLMMGVAGAPFSFFGGVAFTLIATPLWWAGIFGLALSRQVGSLKNTLLALVLIHSISIFPVLRYTEFADWAYRSKGGGGLIVALVIYLLGQLMLWVTLITRTARPAEDRDGAHDVAQ